MAGAPSTTPASHLCLLIRADPHIVGICLLNHSLHRHRSAYTNNVYFNQPFCGCSHVVTRYATAVLALPSPLDPP
jgi:hypothetical protein